jgi:Na+/H+-translocating membrane pyrophosphatase
VLKVQLGLTSLVMTIVLYPVAAWALPEAIHIQGVAGVVTPLTCYFCIISGLWGGCIIGFITEYYTSHSYQPVRSQRGARHNSICCCNAKWVGI